MNAKVLIVDDSALTRHSRQILETAGCEVVEAENGLDALERYFLDKPDVVMLDLVIHGMYRLEMLQKIRELDPRARVVVVSADVQTSSQDMAGEAGAACAINKPFDRMDILAALDAALAGAR